MAGLSDEEMTQLQRHLQYAVVACSDRGLYHSAKWAAELLNSFQPDNEAYGSDTDADSPMDDGLDTQSASQLPIGGPNLDPREARLEARELPRYLLAKTFFDCREFDRCAAVFAPSSLFKTPVAPSSLPSSPQAAKIRANAKGKGKPTPEQLGTPGDPLSRLSQKALFLALYARYLSGEKRKDEDSEMVMGPMDSGSIVNRELAGISRVLGNWLSDRDSRGLESQGWLEYLYGIVQAKSKNDDLAKEWLLKSVHLNPWNWGAWQELSNLLGTKEELHMLSGQLPQNIMSFIFHIYTCQELYQADDDIHNYLNQSESIFPNSTFLKTQRALLYYHSKEFEEAESIFSAIVQAEPYRLDALDNYSNILYVMQLRPKLAFLAQLCSSTDKFRPETCCVVGNYYSMKSEHEKAVMYFRRALTLDRSFLSAWTLMGHEYVEMKNTHAAIESYRRAVDVNRKDYRAWYGLGQTYEVLEMHSYALFYYQRAASLRPDDPKMWQAVGSCFARVGKIQNAIRSYKRALIAGNLNDQGFSASFASQEGLPTGGVLDPESLYQIALLYERVGDSEECAAYMELTLAQEEGSEDDDAPAGMERGVGVTPTTSKARKWLAAWEFSRGSYTRAMELANELCQDGVDVEDAKALVRDIRARLDQERMDSTLGASDS